MPELTLLKTKEAQLDMRRRLTIDCYDNSLQAARVVALREHNWPLADTYSTYIYVIRSSISTIEIALHRHIYYSMNTLYPRIPFLPK